MLTLYPITSCAWATTSPTSSREPCSSAAAPVAKAPAASLHTPPSTSASPTLGASSSTGSARKCWPFIHLNEKERIWRYDCCSARSLQRRAIVPPALYTYDLNLRMFLEASKFTMRPERGPLQRQNGPSAARQYRWYNIKTSSSLHQYERLLHGEKNVTG